MTPYYADDWLTVYGGDCREVLASLPADSVDCVVTSPPYWGLRDYGSDGQLGLEATPEEYVANLVAVFAEVRRVLKSSGTCWLNLGDSYYAAGWESRRRSEIGSGSFDPSERRSHTGVVDGLKVKDLVGIPWRVAFALQADGWYLRSDIIWAKPNPMPESVTDRPTKAHEYLFLLTKSARYYFDADAVREPHKWQDAAELVTNPQARQQKRLAERAMNGDASALRTQDTYKAAIRGERGKGRYADVGAEQNYSMSSAGRNIRSVWTIATRPYPGAHFAVFPPELPERCIKAGSPEGGVVLDPFAGSGTVGMVANRLSRRAILIDLNPEYLKQQMKRNAQTPLGLSA